MTSNIHSPQALLTVSPPLHVITPLEKSSHFNFPSVGGKILQLKASLSSLGFTYPVVAERG
jgi:hypothetical protein